MSNEQYFHANSTGTLPTAGGEDSIAVGVQARTNGNNQLAIGSNALVNNVGVGAIVIGNSATIRSSEGLSTALGTGSIVIGDSAVSYSNQTVVIGDHAANAHGGNVLVGSGTTVVGQYCVTVGLQAKNLGGVGAVAIGANAIAKTTNSVSVGYGAQSHATGAVAIGADSIAEMANSVSVGSAGNERTIVNVADASLSETSTEATTGRQLFVTNQNVASNTQAISSNTNRITQLEGRADVLEHEAVRYDTEQHDVVTFNAAGAETRLSHVAPAVEPNDAVTKVQLDNLDQKLRYFRAQGEEGSDTEAAAEADGSIAVGSHSIAEMANSVSVGSGAQSRATGAVAIGAGSIADLANSVSVGSAGNERTIVNVADASLSETSTEATTGRQLFVTNQNVASNTQAISLNTNRITQLEGRADVLEHEAVRYDTEQHDVVTFNAAGAETRLSHVAPAVAPNDAVTKVQLDNLDQKLRYFRAQGEEGSDTEAAAGADGSIAVGSNARAHMPYSVAMGQGSLSNDHYVMALGANAVADNNAYVGDHLYVSQAFGAESIARNGSLAFGHSTQATAMLGIAMGSDVTLDSGYGVSIGTGSRVRGDHGTAVGALAVAEEVRTVALGATAVAKGSESTAVGSMAQAWGQNSTSLGYTALATGDFSVAIGHQSRAPLAWSVSFGNAAIKRQLVNVAAGIDTNDVVIVGQLNQALERLEKKIAQLEAQLAAR